MSYTYKKKERKLNIIWNNPNDTSESIEGIADWIIEIYCDSIIKEKFNIDIDKTDPER